MVQENIIGGARGGAQRRGGFGSSFIEEYDYIKWLASALGMWGGALAWRLTHPFYDPYYNQWVASGRPKVFTRPPDAPPTEAEMAEQARQAFQNGRIPLKGNEQLREYLEGVGFKLTNSDEFGQLPSGEQFFSKPAKIKKPEEEKGGAIETINGVASLVFRDDKGDIQSIQSLPGGSTYAQRQSASQYQQTRLDRIREQERMSAAQGQISPFQQQQLDLERQRFGLQERQFAGSQRLQQQQLELQRQAQLAQLRANPRDWIRAWFLERGLQGEPTQSSGLEGERASVAGGESKILGLNEDIAQQQRRAMAGVGSFGLRDFLDIDKNISRLQDELKQEKTALQYYKDIIKSEEAGRTPSGIAIAVPQGSFEEGYYGGLSESAPPRPTTPPTPPALASLTELRTGEPIRKVPTRTASGQRFNRLAPSEVQQIGGFLDYAGGGDLQDYLALVQGQLPQPTRTQRVRTARQI